MKIYKRIIKDLDDHKIEYQKFEHEHVHSSKEAAQIRGSKYEEAAKALILKSEKGLLMAIVPGPKKMVYKVLKKELNLKKLSLAPPEEVLEKTKLTIGSIPPFGHYWDIKIYVDKSLKDNEYMVFSAGSHHHSCRLKVDDYLKLIPHEIKEFTVDQ